MEIQTRTEGVRLKDGSLFKKTYEFGGKERTLLELFNYSNNLLNRRPTASMKISSFLLELAERGDIKEREMISSCLNNYNLALCALERLHEAIDYFDKAYKIGEKVKHLALTNKGSTYISQRKYSEAIECLEEALKLKPEYPIARQYLSLAKSNLDPKRS
ncbi:MAG: tetratricopeptide repeat protein [archaeon]